MQRITILGATGSVGVSTLDVVARHSEKYAVFALTGKSKLAILAAQCQKFQPKYAVVMDKASATTLRDLLAITRTATKVIFGVDALCAVSEDSDVDIVMAAIVGAAGLLPTLSAVKADKKVLLANKESLVMAGQVFNRALKSSSAILLPIDSEHNAIFQCLPINKRLSLAGVNKILLSASGGPFKGLTLADMKNVTPDQACAHPNWSMGNKISVDSASMMNKGLELIEACWLFDVNPTQIDIVVHPQSVIHSLVQYVDGSVLAQMGHPDMRTPIAHALAWPERIVSGVDNLNLIEVARLDFEAPDLINFPCLVLALEAARLGQNAPAVLNAANEVAVEAFLQGRIDFTQIAEVVQESMFNFNFTEPDTLELVQDTDIRARRASATYISRIER
jgi:1-deoxy-D-xylulose-5-phosphate reductoisomerase